MAHWKNVAISVNFWASWEIFADLRPASDSGSDKHLKTSVASIFPSNFFQFLRDRYSNSKLTLSIFFFLSKNNRCQWNSLENFSEFVAPYKNHLLSVIGSSFGNFRSFWTTLNNIHIWLQAKLFLDPTQLLFPKEILKLYKYKAVGINKCY
jgi:hypothetical protein